jgi:hypothetical protein
MEGSSIPGAGARRASASGYRPGDAPGYPSRPEPRPTNASPNRSLPSRATPAGLPTWLFACPPRTRWGEGWRPRAAPVGLPRQKKRTKRSARSSGLSGRCARGPSANVSVRVLGGGVPRPFPVAARTARPRTRCMHSRSCFPSFACLSERLSPALRMRGTVAFRDTSPGAVRRAKRTKAPRGPPQGSIPTHRRRWHGFHLPPAERLRVWGNYRDYPVPLCSDLQSRRTSS